MTRRIEDYALIGDTQTAALVARDTSIDWFCAPRFDSDAVLARLLGDERNGRWAFTSAEPPRSIRRAYRQQSLVLDTELELTGGAVRVSDCMPPRMEDVDIVRCLEGLRGAVTLKMQLNPRFGYGLTIPWIRLGDRQATAYAGADALDLRSSVPLREEQGGVVADVTLRAGERAWFKLAWHPSFRAAAEGPEPWAALDDTSAWWRSWSSSCSHGGRWRDAVIRSAITLKALTYGPSGGIVAAPTTSLPEQLGGSRNWDYRFCWLRDATFTLYALLSAGFADEAAHWRDWLLRTVAGEPSALQTLYGPAGERRLTELELPHLGGYEGARPVRIGNGAAEQLQLDVYGEILDCLHQARRHGMPVDRDGWRLEQRLLSFLETAWQEPDEGIWEVRGGRRQFTHSKVMAWAAFDRAVKDARGFGLPGPVERWEDLRDRIHADVCRNAWNARRGSFVQFYGSDALDAALLLIPLVGFLPASDPRVQGTIAAVERELVEDGFVRRYRTDPALDGLPPGEALFLPCSFWLADCYAQLGRREEARALFERLLALRNDVGLLAEEWDPRARRLLGNFPQAFTHVALINTAHNLLDEGGPARSRRGDDA